jgi:hypothetical protein
MYYCHPVTTQLQLTNVYHIKNSRADIAEREFVLRYPGRRHADGNLFQRLEYYRLRTGRVRSTAFVNAGRAQAVVWILTSKNPKIVAVER